ncbi:ribonuclease HI family protein [candidate division KSB1 bacterium]
MDDLTLLRLIEEHLDKKSLFRIRKDLSEKDLSDFFIRLASNLSTASKTITDRSSGGTSDAGLVLYTDGASSGNPGPAAIGVVLDTEDGNNLQEASEVIGTATNNVAEYEAMLYGLRLAAQFNPVKLTVYSDSELLVRQINGEYKAKKPELCERLQKAHELLDTFREVRVLHIRRDKNRRADTLAKNALKKRAARVNADKS